MKPKYINILLLLSIAFAYPLEGYSQKKKAKVAKKPATAIVVQEPTKEEINFENLLPSTAKLQIADSTVVTSSKWFDAIPLSPGMGKIYMEQKDSVTNYTYENEVGSKKIMSIADKKGVHHLYSATKVGKGWSEPVKLSIPGGVKDIICPMLLPDGTTLYFSAREGEDNVGKHDIFYTVYDSDEDKYITPQSLGLPYNSSDEDYYAITDEFNNLAYLVTNRRQKAGNVCVYSFIPTETRETYADDQNIDEKKLHQLALISRIADTQSDKKAISEARNRLQKARQANNSSESITFSFVVKKNVVYHKLSDFKSQANKDKFTTLYQMQVKLSTDEKKLANLRAEYHNGKKATKSDILTLEQSVQAQRINIKKLEKEIRNAEIKP